MELDIRTQYPRVPVDLSGLHLWLRSCLRRLRHPRAELSILLTDDAVIRRLNRRYRGVDRATDILSFGMREQRRAHDPLPPRADLLGDLVVSLPTVRRQAAAAGRAFGAELREVLAHGLLHLLGYEHARPADARRMFALQASLAASGAGRR